MQAQFILGVLSGVGIGSGSLLFAIRRHISFVEPWLGRSERGADLKDRPLLLNHGEKLESTARPTLQDLQKYLERVATTLKQVVADQASSNVRLEAHYTATCSLIGKVDAKMSELRATSVEAQETTSVGARTLASLRSTIDSIREVEEGIEDFDATIAGVFESLDQMKEIASFSKIVSFNVALEASRLGAEGKSVAVIAERMGQFSETVRDLTTKIELIAAQSRSHMSEIRRRMKDKLDGGVEAVESVETSVQSLLGAIEGFSEEVGASIQTVADYNRISRDFSSTMQEAIRTAGNLGSCWASVHLASVNALEVDHGFALTAAGSQREP